MAELLMELGSIGLAAIIIGLVIAFRLRIPRGGFMGGLTEQRLLEQLERDYRAGLVDAEEYERKKKNILERTDESSGE